MTKMFSDLYDKDEQEKARKQDGGSKESREERTRKAGNQESGKEASDEASQEGSEKLARRVKSSTPEPPPSQERPTFKSSYMLTQEEFEMYEDMKLALRRNQGIRAYKNDLARAAIRLLNEDFNENEEDSYLVRVFYQREK